MTGGGGGSPRVGEGETAADASQPSQSDRVVEEGASDPTANSAEGRAAAALTSQAAPWSGSSLQQLNVLIRSMLGNQQAASSQVRW